MNVRDYKTASFINDAKNEVVEGYWPMAIDYGYSSVDGFGPTTNFAFPNYAKEIKSTSLLDKYKDTDIMYRGEDGKLWAVGEMAIELSKSEDVSDAGNLLYGRNRFDSPFFKTISRAGLAMSMKEKGELSPDGKGLVLQTGLPPSYIKEDSSKLKKALAGHHEFDIKIGNEPWMHFDFELPIENIYVIPQPLGSLYSAICQKDANYIEGYEEILSKRTVVLDGGFGTLDTALIDHMRIDSDEMYTSTDFGMRRVIEKTIDMIAKKSDTYYQVHTFQKCLADGFYKQYDDDTMETLLVPFDDMLEEASKEVCGNMLKKVKQFYNNFRDIECIILTGGTCAAWEEQIREFFSKKEDMEIISSNANEPLPIFMSNVRGYYMYLINKLRKL